MKNGVNTAITKNYSISILRVVGMFSIVFCHFVKNFFFYISTIKKSNHTRMFAGIVLCQSCYRTKAVKNCILGTVYRCFKFSILNT